MATIPTNKIHGMQVFERPLCVSPFQLEKSTQELMGKAWVKKFNEWAKDKLPTGPTVYLINSNKMVAHPSIVRQMRNLPYDLESL